MIYYQINFWLHWITKCCDHLKTCPASHVRQTSHFSSRRETHRLCSMKCWSSPSCKDCAISSFRSLIPRPRFSSAANGLPLQLPSSLLLPDD
ncbi:hypothetical protein NC652_009968 [Populus alba x Populus x berolinensis]|nr:hypothetical protein NC652_009968 [Populus alba x Populus x berolinensis]